MLATDAHLARAKELVDRFHGPMGIVQGQLIAVQLDIAMANAHSLAALALEGAALTPADIAAAMQAVEVHVDQLPAEPQPAPSGLLIPGR